MAVSCQIEPVLEVTGEFDLGEAELGQEADRPVRFANRVVGACCR